MQPLCDENPIGFVECLGTGTVQIANLKVALVCYAKHPIAPWVTRLGERICTTDGMDVIALIERREAPTTASMSLSHKLWWRTETKVLAKPIDTPTPHFDSVRTTLPIVDSVDAAAIDALEADIIIDLTCMRGEEIDAGAAAHGVWFLNFLNAATGTTSIRAIANNAPFYKVKLCRKSADGGAPSLISSAVLNLKLFASLNHQFMCEKAVTLIMRELNRINLSGFVQDEGPAHSPMQKPPGIWTMTRYGFGFLRRATKRFIEVQASKLHFRPGEFFLKTSRTDMLTVDPAAMQEHHSTANGYFADPFLWQRDGEMYCFFEVYNYGKDTGHIAVGRLVDGELIDIKPAIKADYHMSFPFLFEGDDGTLFMMPEVCSQKRIETWKCVSFPHQWERVQTVLDDVIAADSSLAKIDDNWWLFTNMSNDPFGEMSSELHVYKVDGPGMTELTPHPLNPVVFDTRVARNGGRVIHSDGAYYRISQDNSRGLYGYGVNAMKIETISMDAYEETLTRKIEPDFQAGIIGSHHMDSRAGMVVLDVRKRVGGFRLRSNEKPRKLPRHSF